MINCMIEILLLMFFEDSESVGRFVLILFFLKILCVVVFVVVVVFVL